MKINSIIFVIAFLIAFTCGYFFFHNSEAAKIDTKSQSVTEETAPGDDRETDDKNTSSNEKTAIPAEAEVLKNKNCLSCHAVESLGVEGGTTGPDLSTIYNEIKNKHEGKTLDEFLQKPNSAVMSTVIGDNPLSDEERASIIETLKKAAEKKTE